MKTLFRLGISIGPMVLLIVRGRKSGNSHTTPVEMFENKGRNVIAAFGNVDWVAISGHKGSKLQEREKAGIGVEPRVDT